jgi:hypothetical protein
VPLWKVVADVVARIALLILLGGVEAILAIAIRLQPVFAFLQRMA